jgi:hypothetical protein
MYISENLLSRPGALYKTSCSTRTYNAVSKDLETVKPFVTSVLVGVSDQTEYVLFVALTCTFLLLSSSSRNVEGL